MIHQHYFTAYFTYSQMVSSKGIGYIRSGIRIAPKLLLPSGRTSRSVMRTGRLNSITNTTTPISLSGGKITSRCDGNSKS